MNVFYQDIVILYKSVKHLHITKNKKLDAFVLWTMVLNRS